jgi:DNA topoisomerase-2
VLKKAGNTSRARNVQVNGLKDATFAGTAKGGATLVIVEGLSAGSAVLAALPRDRFGVLPLTGKVLNVRDMAVTKAMDNKVIKNIAKAIGINHNTSDPKLLRYERVCVVTDQDDDGVHIKALLLNIFSHYYPKMALNSGFVCDFPTPLIRVGDKRGVELETFYTQQQFQSWCERQGVNEADASTRYTIKYFKGLGSMTRDQARETFARLPGHARSLVFNEDSEPALRRYFAKDTVNERKQLISAPHTRSPLDPEQDVTCNEYLDTEMVPFMKEAAKRALPGFADGLKPTQLLTIYAAEKNWTNSTKMVAAVGDLMKLGYAHGDASAAGTMFTMGQRFPGSSNDALIQPLGQYGDRQGNGSNHCQARYAFINTSDLCALTFLKEDRVTYQHAVVDGHPAQYERYAPIFPWQFVRRIEGIGSGYSCYVPPFRPTEVVALLQTWIDGGELTPYSILPCSINTSCVVKPSGEAPHLPGKYTFIGKYDFEGDTIVITETPPGVGTEAFEEKLRAADHVTNFESRSTDNVVHIRFKSTKLTRDTAPEIVVKVLGLSSSAAMTNMTFYDSEKDRIVTSPSVEDYINAWAPRRLKVYERRKSLQVETLEYKLKLALERAAFVEAVSAGHLQLNQVPRGGINDAIWAAGFSPLDGRRWLKARVGNDTLRVLSAPFEHLRSVRIEAMTPEKIAEFKEAAARIHGDLATLKQTAVKDMWAHDLRALNTYLLELERVAKEYVAHRFDDVNATKGTAKRAAGHAAVPHAPKKAKQSVR